MTITKIEKIVEKVRSMYKFGEYRELVEQPAQIGLREIENEIVLIYIHFSSHSTLVVTDTCITVRGEYASSNVLCYYRGWDALLKLR